MFFIRKTALPSVVCYGMFVINLIFPDLACAQSTHALKQGEKTPTLKARIIF